MKGWAQRTFAGMTLEQKLGQLKVSFLDDDADIPELTRAGALGGLFPGTGDIDSDTHMVLPTLPFDLERMDRVELVPYRAGIRAGVRAIMTTHIIFSHFDAEHPATLSRAVLTGLLRERMGLPENSPPRGNCFPVSRAPGSETAGHDTYGVSNW